jgi:transcriptional activator SPT8
VDEWDFADGRLMRSLKLPLNSGPVSCVTAMPNNRHLLCASVDNMRLWDLHAPTDTRMVPFQIIAGHHGGVISQICKCY